MDPAGQPSSDEIVWVLSQETAGWRIMGMAAQLSEGADPVFMNFEDKNHVAYMAGAESPTDPMARQNEPAQGDLAVPAGGGDVGPQGLEQPAVQQAQQPANRYDPGVQ